MSGLAISTRKLKQVPTSIVLFWYCVGGIVFTCLYLLIEVIVAGKRDTFDSYSGRAYLFALGSACFDTLGISMLTLAY